MLYKHIIQVENENVGLKVCVCVGGGGGTNIPLPPNKKSGGHMPPCLHPPPPHTHTLPRQCIRILYSGVTDLFYFGGAKGLFFPHHIYCAQSKVKLRPMEGPMVWRVGGG